MIPLLKKVKPLALSVFVLLLVFFLAIYSEHLYDGTTMALSESISPVSTGSSCEKAQSDNATQADILLQLNPYSVDVKTDTMYSSYFLFRATTYTNQTHLMGMILKRDPAGSYGFGGTTVYLRDNKNKTYAVLQNYYEEHPTDPAKVLVPWSWKLVPRLFLGAPLASPLDYYQLIFFSGSTRPCAYNWI